MIEATLFGRCIHEVSATPAERWLYGGLRQQRSAGVLTRLRGRSRYGAAKARSALSGSGAPGNL